MIKSISKKMGSESGALLMASTLGIFIILSLFAFYLSRMVMLETRNTSFHALDIKTRNLAQSGLEHGLQSFKSSRNPATIQGNFNTGAYSVNFDTLNNEEGTSLPYTHYITLKSTATISEVERNLRLTLSTYPEAFCFSYYGNNSGSSTFNESLGSIVGDMYFNGDVNTSIVSSGTIYNSTGSGGTQLSSAPLFPTLNTDYYDSLLTVTSALPETNGNPDYGVSLDGINDYIVATGYKGITGTAARSIGAWIKTTASGMIVNWGANSPGQRFGIRVNVNQYGNNGALKAEVNSGYTTGTTDLRDGNWHHIVVTAASGISANQFKLYVDGILETVSSSMSRTMNTASSEDVNVGSYTGSNYFFDGDMDKFAIWNNQLSSSEITALYNSGDGLSAASNSGNYNSSSNLVAYWEMDEGSGSSVADSSPNSNTGTLTNGPTWVQISEGNQATSNTTINLPSYTNNEYLNNGDLTLSNVTVNGPGVFVVYGNLTIESNSIIQKNVKVICSGNVTVSNSQIGTSLRTPSLTYSKGITSISGSTIYGLIIAKGNTCTFSSTSMYGAILNSGSTFSLNNTSTVTGSVVSQYSVDIQDANSSITKGSLPPFFNADIGLDPMVVPGSYLEY
ncbi:MAG: LamG domain-containing protein [Candidatus Marinimicrobia bacterium]|nr:LamG domain-containing protein [Candidatus Neomarinimicrobiota bacterium]